MSRNAARQSAFSLLAVIAYSLIAPLLAIVYLLITRTANAMSTRVRHSGIDQGHEIGKRVEDPGFSIAVEAHIPAAKTSAVLTKKGQQIMVRLPHMPPGLPPVCLN